MAAGCIGDDMAANSRQGEVIFKNVTRIARSGSSSTVVLKDCSLTVEAGKLTVLIGPSGCGKTTVINLIAGYERPDRGEILVDGQPVFGPDRQRLVVFQETALFPWLTCYENIMFGPTPSGSMSRQQAHEETLALLNRVGLADFRDKYPAQLSGGMQRRAELARALINRPGIMLMDEPFRGLDAMTRRLMQEYYLGLFDETGCTNLFVTSELDEAIILADRLLVMTGRPSRVRKALEVDLPRPRKPGMAASERYRRIKAEVLELLMEEAVRGGAAGFGKPDSGGIRACPARQAAKEGIRRHER